MYVIQIFGVMACVVYLLCGMVACGLILDSVWRDYWIDRRANIAWSSTVVNVILPGIVAAGVSIVFWPIAFLPDDGCR